MTSGESPQRGEILATLLKGDRYQGDTKWPKKWEATTAAQAKELKLITNNDEQEKEGEQGRSEGQTSGGEEG